MVCIGISESIERLNKNMAIKRVKLNYISAVSNTPPVERIAVLSSHMEELDRAIILKIKQNDTGRIVNIQM